MNGPGCRFSTHGLQPCTGSMAAQYCNCSTLARAISQWLQHGCGRTSPASGCAHLFSALVIDGQMLEARYSTALLHLKGDWLVPNWPPWLSSALSETSVGGIHHPTCQCLLAAPPRSHGTPPVWCGWGDEVPAVCCFRTPDVTCTLARAISIAETT